MNLIIAASLSEPPTDGLMFRHVIYTANKQLKMDCLIEVEQMVKDSYYKFLFKRGLMDNVAQLITPPEKIHGLRLSPEQTVAPSVPIESITWINVKEIIGIIQAINGISNF